MQNDQICIFSHSLHCLWRVVTTRAWSLPGRRVSQRCDAFVLPWCLYPNTVSTTDNCGTFSLLGIVLKQDPDFCVVSTKKQKKKTSCDTDSCVKTQTGDRLHLRHKLICISAIRTGTLDVFSKDFSCGTQNNSPIVKWTIPLSPWGPEDSDDWLMLATPRILWRTSSDSW